MWTSPLNCCWHCAREALIEQFYTVRCHSSQLVWHTHVPHSHSSHSSLCHLVAPLIHEYIHKEYIFSILLHLPRRLCLHWFPFVCVLAGLAAGLQLNLDAGWVSVQNRTFFSFGVDPNKSTYLGIFFSLFLTLWDKATSFLISRGIMLGS